MTPGRRWRAAVAVAGLATATLAALLALAGCGKKLYQGVLPANQRPEVELTQVPASPSQDYFYAYEIRWAGYDPDGSVSHYLYCIDPPSAADADTPWVSTTANREVFEFRSDSVGTPSQQVGRGYHTFVLKAVDDGGMMSAPVYRSFNSFTLTPTVKITSPVVADTRFIPKFGPAFRLAWTGDDPDGRSSRKPVKYKYKLFEASEAGLQPLDIMLRPDTLLRLYAPGFASWDSVGGDTTQVNLDNLTEGSKLLVVVAFDEAGAYSPVFKLYDNMMPFEVSYKGLGTVLTVYNEIFYYQYPGPLFSLEEKDFIVVDLPADRPLTFQWSGVTKSSGTFVSGYRWRLDGDVSDETQRTNESTDIGRWSRWSNFATSCVLPPISPPPGQYAQTHFFYLEARDSEGRLSLAVVKFTAVRPQFDRDLLIVDDTRLKLDTRLTSGAYARPSGAWPTAAELDTFFFAVGNRPWREYPAGIVSPVGVFQGYDFDTLATRYRPAGLVSLADLGHYRNIVWYVDYKSSTNTNTVDYVRDPMPFLHHASYPGRVNPLTVWVGQGGKLWMFGGGTASCLQREYERGGTNGLVYAAADSELVPGRFLYDFVHWRSEITNSSLSQARWSTAGAQAWPGMPDYSSLPANLREKTTTTDPISVYGPNRTNASEYYQTVYSGEALTKANSVLYDADPDPNVVNMQPALDTLYVTSGGSVGAGRPIMTLYHGPENQQLVYSGFPLWYFQREQILPIVDWVLQTLWGLPRRPVTR